MEKDREKKIQEAEMRLQNQEGSKILRAIIAKTYSRHALLNEQEFLKEIGFEGSGKTEDEAIRIATFNVLVETSLQLFRAKNSLELATNTLKMLFNVKNTDKGE